MTGSPALLLPAALLVLVMLAPAFALFFAGLSGRRSWLIAGLAALASFALAVTVWMLLGVVIQVALFQAAVTAVAVMTVLSVGLRAGRARGYLVFVAVWVLLVLVPVGHGLFDIDSGLLSLWLGTLDFAGSGVIAVSVGAAAVSFAIVGRGAESVNNAPPIRPVWMLVLSGVLGGVGLVALALGSELVVDSNTPLILSTMLWAMAAGTLGWTAAQLVNVHRPTVAGYVAGFFAGGVAVLAGVPWIDTGPAIALGLSAGILGHVTAVASRRAGAGPWATVIAVLFVPGSIGMLLLGVVDRGSGLIFSGNLVALTNQALGLAVVIGYSFAVSVLLALIVRRTLGPHAPAPGTKPQERPAVMR